MSSSSTPHIRLLLLLLVLLLLLTLLPQVHIQGPIY
jgi:hypothetical protein